MKIINSESWVDGSSLTYDGETNSGYLHVDPSPDAFAPTTHDIGHGILVDVAHGRIRGIKLIGREIDVLTLVRVLRWCQWNPSPETGIK